MGARLHLKLAAELDVHVALIFISSQKVRVIGLWRLAPGFHKKVTGARQGVIRKALKRGPEMAMFEGLKVSLSYNGKLRCWRCQECGLSVEKRGRH